MTDPSSTGDQPFRPLLRAIRNLMFGRNGETLRESIEEALQDHAADAPDGDNLSAAERLMLRNLLDFGERPVGGGMVPSGARHALHVAQTLQAWPETPRPARHLR